MEKGYNQDSSFLEQVGKKYNQSKSPCEGRLIHVEVAEPLKKTWDIQLHRRRTKTSLLNFVHFAGCFHNS